jgi:hypothetical protein
MIAAQSTNSAAVTHSVPAAYGLVAATMRWYDPRRVVETALIAATAPTPTGFSTISSLKQLQYLDLSWASGITDMGVESIATLSLLRYLDLGSCSKVTNDGVAILASLVRLEHLGLADFGHWHCEGHCVAFTAASSESERMLNYG